jgi:hypothetical protein
LRNRRAAEAPRGALPGPNGQSAGGQNVAGIEGFDVEYWSPAPFWKKNKSSYGDTIASADPTFVNQFTDALADDLKYFQTNGLHVAMWGIQNEQVVHVERRRKTGLSERI